MTMLAAATAAGVLGGVIEEKASRAFEDANAAESASTISKSSLPKLPGQMDVAERMEDAFAIQSEKASETITRLVRMLEQKKNPGSGEYQLIKNEIDAYVHDRVSIMTTAGLSDAKKRSQALDELRYVLNMPNVPINAFAPINAELMGQFAELELKLVAERKGHK